MRGTRCPESSVSNTRSPLGDPILQIGRGHCCCHRYLAVQPGFKAGPARLSGLPSKVVRTRGNDPPCIQLPFRQLRKLRGYVRVSE